MEYNSLTEFEEINIDNADRKDVDITILCSTYNHEQFIKVALDSFVSQQTDASFEVLIYDDASTDNTSKIIREYAKRYPKIIKAFIAKENTYSDPHRKETNRAWRKRFISGRYIAFCEGDDYWLDNKKLQKQFEVLESHPEYDMCACRGVTVTEDGKKEISEVRPRVGDGILSTEEVILGGGQYLVSAGLVYRKTVKEKQMECEKILSIDYVTQIKGSLRGGIYYIDQKMAAYRRFVKGSWSLRVLMNKEKLKQAWNREEKMLRVFDLETDGRFHNAIEERIKSYVTFEDQLEANESMVMKLISSLNGSLFLWGLGRRGVDFESFCANKGINLAGVCDLANLNVGEKTLSGNQIYHTDDVLQVADNILASNGYAYNFLKNQSFVGKIINLQEYMPYG